MVIDLPAAVAFAATHARLLDRRRLRLLLGASDPDPVLAALDGYRNPDGGYGWGMEPDLRSTTSQPGAALHAFEVFEDIAPTIAPQAAGLCDWLASASLGDGGLPFALPVTDTAGCAPFWAQADSSTSSLQITGIVAANAWCVARHDRAVAEHPWLARATRYCLDAIRAVDQTPHAIELAFALRFLDAVHDTHPEAASLLQHLGAHLPEDGVLSVAGGSPGEALHPLDVAPEPDRPVRALFTPEIVAADLRRLAGLQQTDGGWFVDFASYSAAAALEWRGYLTVTALSILRRNDAL